MSSGYVKYMPLSGGSSGGAASTIRISYTPSTLCYSYNKNWSNDAEYNLNIKYTLDDVEYTFTHTILGLNVIHHTNLPQKAEDLLMEFVSELDKDFVDDMGGCIDSYLHDKSYDIAECVLDEALKDEYRLAANVTRDMIIEAIVCDIDFGGCYEILDNIRHAPHAFEEHLRDIGMSISDFI